MFVPFESLPPDARVWIFQSNRPFSAKEKTAAEVKLRAFTDEWSVHGIPLNTSYRIEYDQFIVLGADERDQQASGCSIDSSVRALKELEHALDIQLFDRSLVAFRTDDKVLLVPLGEIKQKFQEGILTGDTPTFNNLVSTRAEFEKGWLVPAKQTWLTRYMTNPLVKVK